MTQTEMPEELRKAWAMKRNGLMSGVQLSEMSMNYAITHCLEDYRYRRLPTPPDKVRRFREMDAQTRSELTEKAISQHFVQNQDFYDEESRVRQTNYGDLAWLKKLMTYAKDKEMPDSVIIKIQNVLATHLDR